MENEVAMSTPHHPSIAVRHALRKLGQDINDARCRRGLAAEVVAGCAFTTRPTLRRIETGDHGVGMGIYAAVLQALELLDGLPELSDPSKDAVGLLLSSGALPERVRLRRQKARSNAE